MQNLSFFREYAEKMKTIQESLLCFIENEKSTDIDFESLINFIDDQQICENKNSFKSFLHLLIKISNNHCRSSGFMIKIQNIIQSYQTEIKQFFSNYDIFNIFKSSKLILLYLLNQKVIIPDKTLANIIINGKYKERFYPDYFYPEFGVFYDEYTTNRIKRRVPEVEEGDHDKFERRRKLGENDKYISKLIRNDLIDEFINYVNHANISLTMKIEDSIYETNNFLLGKSSTLIEYAAFFGSVHIFKYLFLNKVSLSSSLWLYAIHGNNSEIIHFLEEKSVVPVDVTYQECLKEAIKCHYIDLSEYIKCNLFQMKNEQELCCISQSLRYYNFIDLLDFVVDDVDESKNLFKINNLTDFDLKSKFFYDMCKYDHTEIVDFFLKNITLDINFKNINEINNLPF